MDPARRPHPATEGVRVRAVRKPFRGAVSRQLRLWHWVSSALCLGGLLFFTVTGITLNHASDIEAAPSIEEKRLTLPPGHLEALRAAASAKAATLPEPLAEERVGAADFLRLLMHACGRETLAPDVTLRGLEQLGCLFLL